MLEPQILLEDWRSGRRRRGDGDMNHETSEIRLLGAAARGAGSSRDRATTIINETTPTDGLTDREASTMQLRPWGIHPSLSLSLRFPPCSPIRVNESINL